MSQTNFFAVTRYTDIQHLLQRPQYNVHINCTTHTHIRTHFLCTYCTATVVFNSCSTITTLPNQYTQNAVAVDTCQLYTQNASNFLAPMQNFVHFCILVVVIPKGSLPYSSRQVVRRQGVKQ